MNQARPVYLKLRDQIAAAIIEGDYPEGAMLPSVRALAAEEGAHPVIGKPLPHLGEEQDEQTLGMAKDGARAVPVRQCLGSHGKTFSN